MTAPVRHFLRDDDITVEEQEAVLVAAERLARDPRAGAGLLSGTAIGLYFEKHSLRTRVSSEVAASRLGAHPVQLRREELQLARGETLEDSARVLAGYLGLLMGRVYDHATLSALAAPGTLPVVNGLSDRFHPLQVLADLLTMRMEWGADLRERTLAYVGDGNNVAASLLLGGAMAGLRVVVAAPSGYAPDGGVVAEAMAIAATTGGDVAVTEDASEAADGADVLYTDVWTSMGMEGEEETRRDAFAGFRLDAGLVARARPDVVVLHCLPAHRGEEIAADVIDGPHSRVFAQAHNRLPATAALFLMLCDAAAFRELSA
ncbi:MAG: ornithine carbamoyltransferase [Acidimicrobiia bacterium]|nr:ornithine carbamoyltransferase [Acidimicrobiia bacterium]